MPTITFEDRQLICQKGERLLDVLIAGGVFVDAPCGGNGTCGKCQVAIRAPQEIQSYHVLSCQYNVENDLFVTYAHQSSKIAESGIFQLESLRPLIEKKETRDACSFWAFGEQIAAVTSSGNYGIAVDIGTTTVVAYLCNLETGVIEKTLSSVNKQKAYGADVISRINACMEQADNLASLQQIICRQLGELACGLCSCISPEQIHGFVIAGNTTMLHLLTGTDPQGIAVAPFTPKFLGAVKTTPQLLGIDWEPPAVAYLLPGISAYVGADICASILSSGMCEKEATSLLLDIGTNGEMALYHKGVLTVCATAAGPAFEGYSISCGTGGVTGAIHQVESDGSFQTIGGQLPPIGICGSGIVDAVAMLLDKELVEDTGYMEEAYAFTDTVKLFPKDIREIQLAKAAVYAGIQTLAHNAGIGFGEIQTVYLAGGFGSFLNPSAAARIGLIPSELTDKAVPIGNAAGMGCVLTLMDRNCVEKLDQIHRTAQYIELSSSKEFQDFYIDAMFFES